MFHGTGPFLYSENIRITSEKEGMEVRNRDEKTRAFDHVSAGLSFCYL